MVDWLYYVLLLILGVTGLALNILGLPGLWLMVGAAGLYALLTGFEHLGIWGFLVLFLLAVMAEILETVLGGVAAKKVGGSKRGMVGAIVGGLIGGIAGTPLIPIPIVGTIIGACIGSFIGAFGVELFWLRKTPGDSFKIGTGAAAGRFMGIIAKSAVGIVMLLVTVIWAIPLWHSTPPTLPPSSQPTLLPLPPTTLPATAPATTTASPSQGGQ